MTAIGSVGEFGPIVGLAILLDHRNPVRTGLLLGRAGSGSSPGPVASIPVDGNQQLAERGPGYHQDP